MEVIFSTPSSSVGVNVLTYVKCFLHLCLATVKAQQMLVAHWPGTTRVQEPHVACITAAPAPSTASGTQSIAVQWIHDNIEGLGKVTAQGQTDLGLSLMSHLLTVGSLVLESERRDVFLRSLSKVSNPISSV